MKKYFPTFSPKNRRVIYFDGGERPTYVPEDPEKRPLEEEKNPEAKGADTKQEAGQIFEAQQDALAKQEAKATTSKAVDTWMDNEGYPFTPEDVKAIERLIPRDKKEQEVAINPDIDGHRRTISWKKNGEFMVSIYGTIKKTYPKRI